MKTALITGVTGQDGSFLAELLLDKGYKVFGMARRESWLKPNSASHLAEKIEVLFGDMSEGVDISSAIQRAAPDEVYNLASQSRPGESWARAQETLLINGMGAVRLFESVRHNRPQAKVYHASSSEMFGQVCSANQNEETAFNPSSPYAAAKVYAHHMARIYRNSFGLFISTGILFNHESERRPLHFVTQKIAFGAACASLGINFSTHLNELGHPVVDRGKLSLGNLNVSRDWGHATDFVRAMWLMLQQDQPGEFVVGTGELHTLSQLCQTAYDHVGLNWKDYVVSDPSLIRPLDTGESLADASKAREILGWQPIVSFTSMVGSMVDAKILELKSMAVKNVSI
jgi:GDPmannose 4,6-dehydratase